MLLNSKGTLFYKRKYGLKNRAGKRRLISCILIASMLLSLTSCSLAQPTDYGQALKQLNSKEDILNSLNAEQDFNNSDSSGNTVNPGSQDTEMQYADTENAEFEAFLDDCFKKAVTSNTMDYNYSVVNGKDFGIEPPEATLGDASLDSETLKKQKEDDLKYQEELLKFETAELTKDERFIYECMKTEAELNLHVYDNIYFYEPFSPMRGLQANYPTTFTDYRFDDKSDVEDYVIMMGQMKDFFDTALEFEYEKSKAGYFMADKIADKVIEQCDEFIAERENHFLIEVFNSRVDELSFLTDKEKEEYKKRNKDAVLNSAIPAFEDLKKVMTELKGTGKNELGLYYYDGGREYYSNYLFPKYSGSAKTPEKEIQILTSRQQAEVMEITLLYSSNPEAYQYFSEHYSNLYENYDNMDVSSLLDYLMENAMDDYPKMDKIPYQAKYLDKPLEKIMENALAYYMAPALDDEENNLIYVNGAHKKGMWTTLAHEGCPGHMYQNAYYMSTDPKPIRAIQNNLGYKEGWAVYSSYNSLDKCDYDGSPYAKTLAELSKLNEDLGYMLYGRIDLGVNYEGWTLSDVQNLMTASGYGTDSAEDIMNIVIGDPGVYLSYSVSYYEMEELRQRAEDKLGSKFNVQEFHKVILDAGPCQFINLSKKVDEYIESK